MALWPFGINDELPPPAEDTAVFMDYMSKRRDALHQATMFQLEMLDYDIDQLNKVIMEVAEDDVY
jgi:hypothetical protein